MLFADRWGIDTPVATGIAYGATIWLLVNSLALPFLFRRATPWEIGWPAIWPSLAVHMVYGAATCAALARPPKARAASAANRS